MYCLYYERLEYSWRHLCSFIVLLAIINPIPRRRCNILRVMNEEKKLQKKYNLIDFVSRITRTRQRNLHISRRILTYCESLNLFVQGVVVCFMMMHWIRLPKAWFASSTGCIFRYIHHRIFFPTKWFLARFFKKEKYDFFAGKNILFCIITHIKGNIL